MSGITQGWPPPDDSAAADDEEQGALGWCADCRSWVAVLATRAGGHWVDYPVSVCDTGGVTGHNFTHSNPWPGSARAETTRQGGIAMERIYIFESPDTIRLSHWCEERSDEITLEIRIRPGTLEDVVRPEDTFVELVLLGFELEHRHLFDDVFAGLAAEELAHPDGLHLPSRVIAVIEALGYEALYP